ncbi:hypothetical protein EVA_21921 [gut metagenome]|uniref:Uncharacterized protein n=1 Tax=gut metagenome TaxID=749906 RepID=J9FK08_9ZZZZ
MEAFVLHPLERQFLKVYSFLQSRFFPGLCLPHIGLPLFL